MNTVIVEDSEHVQASLRHALARLPGVRVTATAQTPHEALHAIDTQRPDLILLDLSLRQGSGLDVLKTLRQRGNAARVVVFSNHAQPPYREACLKAGADAFFDKSRETKELFEQIMAWLPPIGEDEAIRLLGLYALDVLDTPEEEAFDELAMLAANIVNAPVALISLVDRDRQWFKSHIGLALKETSRAVSICAHAIQQSELFVVPDTLQDPRFAAFPFVRGKPGYRFYAGAPLLMPDGHAAGTLCVLDTQPRDLSPDQRHAMTVLARQVMTELLLRQRVTELEWEVERRRAAEVRLAQLATRDPLTGLANRAALMDRLKQAIKSAERDRHALAFMFIDLDRFKLINDSMGQHAGDEVLQFVAQRLTASLRESDSVARLGGDEFAVILNHVETPQQAMLVAEKLIASINREAEVAGRLVRVDCSIGLALYPQHGEQEEFLIRHADLAMYHAKQDNSQRWRVYAAEMDTAASERLTLEWGLRQALEKGELELHYQPQINMTDGRVVGAEALVRWRHPRLGLLTPQRFIPLAEETGLICQLGAQVLNQATAQLAQWRAEGLGLPRLSVNISPQQLTPKLLQHVRTLIKRYALPASTLDLEITEYALTTDGPAMHQLLNDLHRLGVSLSIDDFGVGYSSLALLRHLPLDVLKIDKSFVDGITGSRQDATIVQAILDMAHGLELDVVAEGVETNQQHDLLKSLGCDHAQGYLFSHPLPADEFAAWLRARQATQNH